MKRIFRRRKDSDLGEEIRARLEMTIRGRIPGGEDPSEAEANTRREFGNAPLVKEATRDMRGWRWFETLRQGLRKGFCQLRRNPGFTAVAVAILALGIGATTAIFTLMNAVMRTRLASA